jgi:epoxyqueuosine reductase
VNSAAIKRAALDIGFDAVGIVAAGPLEAEGELLRGWLGKNYHGTMAWMEREPEKRADPRLLMPGVRSIVVVLHNYFTPHEHTEEGKISRYAWGDDYHAVLKEKLNELLAHIKEQRPDANAKICVDTTPFMDKAWAARAGLGWIGKSSNLITTTHGSWVFIGSLLLDIELDHDDVQMDDHCGTCTMCLDACPTQAIVEPYVVDARQCISYATIELRDDELPYDTDGWLYGCDICQDVCPWNRFEKPTSETRFEPRRGETSLSPNTIAAMDHEAYVERFRRSGIKRTKLTGLKRNAKMIHHRGTEGTEFS